jgi:hypothetical protein
MYVFQYITYWSDSGVYHGIAGELGIGARLGVCCRHVCGYLLGDGVCYGVEGRLLGDGGLVGTLDFTTWIWNMF